MSRIALRTLAAGMTAAALSAGLCGGLWHATHSRTSVVAWTLGEVPAARAILTPHGSAFALSGDGIEARGIAAEGATMATLAPKRARDAFRISAMGSTRAADVSLAAALDVPARIENGTVVYANAYDDIDVVAVPAKDALEVAYVVRSTDATAKLALRVAHEEGDSLRHEPTTGAALVVGRDGRARLRIAAPVAVDARGKVRRGTYSLEEDEIRIAMDWRDLATPIVVDPALTFPLWTILGDARGPGSRIYDPASTSREVHFASDSTRHRVVAVRPIRTQQPEDSIFLFGDASRAWHEQGDQLISPILRSGTGTREGNEWARGFATESETWEWDGAAWSMNDNARLPGIVDPSMAFDATRGHVVLYGGAAPGLKCEPSPVGFPFLCMNVDAADVTYEYDGSVWSARKLAGSPTPRLRASMAFDPVSGRTILFGGRELETRDTQKHVDTHGPVFPDNVTRGLLNDTWAYNGTTWQRIATASPPPAREGAQLVADPSRKMMVLVGGRVDTGSPLERDALAIWELDGTDWVQKLRHDDPSLPLSLQTRRGMNAFWNPIRERVMLTGGIAAKLEMCTLSDADIAQQVGAMGSDASARAVFAATGCLGGYMHDQWEWDGARLTKIADTAFGGMVGSEPVFRQIAGGASWATSGPSPESDGGLTAVGTTPLLPWRYDSRGEHFALRTILEQAHAPSDAGAPTPSAAAIASVATSTVTTFASPLVAARIHGDVVFDTARGVAQFFAPEDGGVYDFDGASWVDRTPASSPFAAGGSDYFGATWDAQNQRIVLFDPGTGATWLESDVGGWVHAAPVNSPPAWGLGPHARTVRDLWGPQAQNEAQSFYSFNESLGSIAMKAPRMAFDRARSRVVMIYAGATWQFDGQTWTSSPLPSSWTKCAAATEIAFDGARGRTVAFGCTVPAQTWEFDGATWNGPGVSPYVDLVKRDLGIPTQNPFDHRIPWRGTTQLAYAHPNAAFESPALGGVSMIDSAGTLRTWNGSTWMPGPAMASGYGCVMPSALTVFSTTLDELTGQDLLPVCFFPPVVEDVAHSRILAFRNGPRGMQKVALTEAAASRSWTPVELGELATDFSGFTPYTRANPYPFELMAAEHMPLMTETDPTTRTYDPGVTPPDLPSEEYRVGERSLPNVLWRFRLLSDPASGRIRVLTHRGMIWELGGESVKGLGDSCTSDAECAQGGCSVTEKVCCDNPVCTGMVCMTCKAPGHAGVCSPVPAGLPDVVASDANSGCGTGECAGVCPGRVTGIVRDAHGGSQGCVFDGTRACGAATSCAAGALTPSARCSTTQATCIASTPQACPGGLACTSDGTSCKAQCTSRVDCGTRYFTCAAGGSSCVADQASAAAAAQGITPVDFNPPPLRTTESIKEILSDAGVPVDDAGRFILHEHGGVALAFDPTLRTPATGLRTCMSYVTACMLSTNEVDRCVAATPRCATSTPWLGDVAGDDCCPEACLLQYFNARQRGAVPSSALASMSTLDCYAPSADGGAQ